MRYIFIFFSIIFKSQILCAQDSLGDFRVVEYSEIVYSVENPYGLHRSRYDGELISGWVVEKVSDDFIFFKLKNGIRDGYYAWYKKVRNGYCLIHYSFYLNGACAESVYFKGTPENRQIKSCMIYDFTKYPQYCNPSLLWIEVSYKKNHYKIELVYNYGKSNHYPKLNFRVKELNTYNTPLIVTGGIEALYFKAYVSSIESVSTPPK